MALENKKSPGKIRKETPSVKSQKNQNVGGLWSFIFCMFQTFWDSLPIFCLKARLFNFCESFISYFENLHYLLHLNESEDDVSEEKDLKNDSSVEIRDVNKFPWM